MTFAKLTVGVPTIVVYNFVLKTSQLTVKKLKKKTLTEFPRFIWFTPQQLKLCPSINIIIMHIVILFRTLAIFANFTPKMQIKSYKYNINKENTQNKQSQPTWAFLVAS